ncbi:hypothetical protein [Flagellimonas sp. CMM7]|uniref:hypothetical protein n=1 Tax=Flagellimonas sp. CMM7 TaxID=2654676 RepID=UPI0013D197B6|nr:hypothetical protein [Flagellimonas sp. CMM7]UII79997.1 hypothetical protein LV704_00400 [Flagellimonas sp. CMM7]
MSDLTTGRKEPCKNNLGGLKRIYLTEYVQYPNKLMVGRKTMKLTSFPTTLLFEYQGNNKDAYESLNGDFYDQTVSFRMSQQDASTISNLSLLMKSRLRAVVVDWKAKNKVYGLENGLDIEIQAKSGSGKSDFNGYEITLKGQEQFQAPFVDYLPDSGFFTEGVLTGCLLSSSGKPSSIGDLVSSCKTIINEVVPPSFLSSSGRPSSVGYLTSSV